MKYKIALEILQILENNNFESYIIGGYPRDKYLNIKTIDIDITTSAKIKNLKKLFDNITETKYGSMKLTYKENEFEITTFRKENRYKENRYPKKIKYTKKLKTDLKRRDFTINTLCINYKEETIDLLNAKKDLDTKTIKLIGKKSRLKDDSLRILRAIRLATILNFNIDEKTSKAIIKYKEYIKNLSYDRKKQELEKILTSKNVNYGFELINKYKLQDYLNINVKNIIITKNINGIWAQIIKDDTYNFKKQDKKEITTIQKLIKKEFNVLDLYKYGVNILETVNEIKKEQKDIKKIYDKLPIKDREEIDINFFEICKIINVSNNEISKIYDDIESNILKGNLKNKKTIIEKFIKENY